MMSPNKKATIERKLGESYRLTHNSNRNNFKKAKVHKSISMRPCLVINYKVAKKNYKVAKRPKLVPAK